jgi:hypothetical protein
MGAPIMPISLIKPMPILPKQTARVLKTIPALNCIGSNSLNGVDCVATNRLICRRCSLSLRGIWIKRPDFQRAPEIVA